MTADWLRVPKAQNQSRRIPEKPSDSAANCAAIGPGNRLPQTSVITLYEPHKPMINKDLRNPFYGAQEPEPGR
jgi:hypothetical protein